MERCLEGKRILVTGGSRGIGRAICELFAQRGAQLLINYSSKADSSDTAINSLLKNIKDNNGIAIAYDLDVSDISGHEKMLEFILQKYGGIDILVNNAGILAGGFTPYYKITEEQWDKSQDVNVKGAFFLTQKIIPYIKRNQPDEFGLRGTIIFLSSAGSDRGGVLQHHYKPTKAAVNSLVACFSETLGPEGIRVNGIAPGTIVTDINRYKLEKNPEETEIMRKNIPLQRLGTIEDVAQVALFLANDKMSRYVNGTIITVDGGWHSVLPGQTKTD